MRFRQVLRFLASFLLVLSLTTRASFAAFTRDTTPVRRESPIERLVKAVKKLLPIRNGDTISVPKP